MELAEQILGSKVLAANLFKTDCEIHGSNVEALLNGKCIVCYRGQQSKALATEKRQDLLNRKSEMGIPTRFTDATCDNYVPNNDRSAKLLEFCKVYDFDTNVIMLGNTGNGKTHLGCAILDRAIAQKLTGFYVPFYRIAEIKIKSPDLFRKIIKCDLLIVDEYGVQESDFKSNLLYEVINERYNNEVYTIIISNLSIDVFKKSIGDPLYSRLKSRVVVKSCNWDDYRLKDSKDAAFN
ncbi:MAG: replication protein DnaC [Pseudomonadota bacterium]|nr:replication protein DnaC [Pseudomonadota bacterium]